MRPRDWRKGYYKVVKALVKACRDYPEYMPAVQELILNNRHWLSVSVDDELLVSYANSYETRFNTRKRVKTTIGRFLMRRMGVTKNPADFAAEFTACRIEQEGFEEYIHVLSGEAVIDAYEEGVGDSSCMTGENSYLVRLYADNPEKVQLLILRMDECDVARALWWTCDDGTKVLDRIYPDDQGQHIAILRRYAKANGGTHRLKQGAPSESKNHLADGSVRTITVRRACNRMFPFIDTFCFGKMCNDGEHLVLSNELRGMTMLFNKIDGRFSDADIEVVCDGCGHTFNLLETIDVHGVGTLCRSCHSMLHFCDACNMCVIDENFIHVDGVGYCSECARIYIVTCGVCGCRHNEVDMRRANNTWMCPKCYDESNATQAEAI